MKRFMYLVIWGVCIRPLEKLYHAETTDAHGAPTTELDSYEYRPGDGYLITIKTVFDLACDKSPLQLFIEGDNRTTNFSASHRVDDGVIELSPDDLKHFEPGDIIDREYYAVETDEEIEALNQEFDTADFCDEFPNLGRLYQFSAEQTDLF